MKNSSLILTVSVVLITLLAGCGEVEVITPEATDVASSPPPRSTSTASPMETATVPISPPRETATPTITPTPLVHFVQEGDTLGSIAAAYGVSVQAIQTANQIENPLLLQIGQRIVIPTGEGPAPEVPGLLLPTPTPMSFSVRGVSFYETPVGSLWCLGEVVNTTPVSLTNIVVQVDLFDAAGNLLVRGNAFANADVLPPTARAPFGILFISPPPNFAGHQATIVRGEEMRSVSAGYVPLPVELEESGPSGAQFELSGVVRNGTENSITGAQVVVTTYDEAGNVTGFRQQEIEEDIPPGGTVSFRMLMTPHGALPADFSIISFGRIR